MSRPLAALASFILAVLGVVFLLPPQCASACSCALNLAPGELRYSSAVFSGEVVDFDKSSFHAAATLRVSEVWKGPEQGTLEVKTTYDEAFCGYPFEEGQEYLVYAEGGKDRLSINLCSETKLLSKASTDLEVLGSGKTPVGGDEPPLSDTSGGVSVRAMVGMAGLLMAVSYFIVARLVRTGYR